MKRNVFSTFVVSSFVLGLGSFGAIHGTIHSAQAQQNSISSLGPGFGDKPPVIGQVFTSCTMATTQAMDALKGLLDKKNKNKNMPIDINTDCNAMTTGKALAPFTVRDLEDSEKACKRLGAKGALEKYLAANENALWKRACEEGKLKAIEGELNCVKDHYKMLSDRVSSTIKPYYADRFEAMKKTVESYDLEIKDREAQMADINWKLGEDVPGRGRNPDGLLAAKAELDLLMTGGPGGGPIEVTVTQLAEQIRATETERTKVEEVANSMVMGKAMQCFQSDVWIPSGSTSECGKGQGNTNAQDAILCRVYQACHASNGGIQNRRNDNKVTMKSKCGEERVGADGRRMYVGGPAGALAGVLQKIYNDSASITTFPTPTDNKKLASTAVQGVQGYKTWERIDQHFGKQLDAFKMVDGSSAYTLMRSRFNQCYQQAVKRVAAERNSKNEGIGAYQEQIRISDVTNRTQANQTMDRMNAVFTKSMKALTGHYMVPPISGCRTGTPSAQANCLEVLHGNLRALQKGTVPEKLGKAQTLNFDQLIPAMTIKGTKDQNKLTYKCTSVDGCISALRSKGEMVQNIKQQNETNKTSYITARRTEVRKHVEMLTSGLSQEASALKARREQINSALAALGVKKTVNFPAMEKEDLEPRDDKSNQLYEMPQDMMKLLGGKAGLPDLGGEAMGDAISAIADASEHFNDNEKNPPPAQPDQLRAMSASCASDSLKKIVEGSQSNMDAMLAACGSISRDSDSTLSDLVSSMRETLDELGTAVADGELDPSLVQALDTGYTATFDTSSAKDAEICDGKIKAAEAKYTEVKAKYDRKLASAEDVTLAEKDVSVARESSDCKQFDPGKRDLKTCLAVSRKFSKDLESAKKAAKKAPVAGSAEDEDEES